MKKLLFILLLIGLGNTTLQAQDFKKGTFILMEAQSPEMPQTIKVNGIKTFASSQTTSFSRFTDNEMPSLYPKKVKKGEIDMSSAAQEKSAYTNSALQSFSSLKINTKTLSPSMAVEVQLSPISPLSKREGQTVLDFVRLILVVVYSKL